MIAYQISDASPKRRQRSPLEENVWLMPAGCTDVEPPEFDSSTHTCAFNGTEWAVTEIPTPELEPTPEPVPAMDQLRSQRNALLAETDWWCVSDRTSTSEQLAYRQALRDLPANCTPALDEDGNLTGITWPTPPND